MAELSDLTAQCIRCGFCLESCPTFVVSGRETESPRGRIYLARSLEEGVLSWTPANREPLDTCVGCRACETACPSGVRYGQILELVRHTFAARLPDRRLGLFLEILTRPRLFRAALALGGLFPGRRVPAWLSRGLSGAPSSLRLPRVAPARPWPDLTDAGLPPVTHTAHLVEGCAMTVLFPEVHEATIRLFRRVGVRLERVGGCCGALHAHNGRLEAARDLAHRLAQRAGAGSELVVNSAGCGSWLKEHAAELGVTVRDATEVLVERGLVPALHRSPGLSHADGTPFVATYHDACHLAHGQRLRTEPRALLDAVPGLRRVPLMESDMCCGSGGVYNVLQPMRARELLDRKWGHIVRTGAEGVVMGNPGCQSWIEQAVAETGSNVRTFHTLEVLEASFSGLLEPV